MRDITTILGLDAVIEGEIRFKDGLRVDGEVEGNAKGRLDKDPASVLVVGESGVVHGDASADVIIVQGRILGAAKASQKIDILAGGAVLGGVDAPVVNDENV